MFTNICIEVYFWIWKRADYVVEHDGRNLEMWYAIQGWYDRRHGLV